MEERIDRIHGEVIFHLDNKEVDHLFIRLEEVDGIVTTTNKDLAIFRRKHFGILLVDDGGMSEFE